MHQHEPNDWKKYVIVLFITSTIFISGLWISNYFNNKKVDQLKSIESSISLDLLSSETQFDLMGELSCKDVSTTVLSSSLNSLADKISYSENNIGTDNTDVITLKKNYSLLEIKDYLLMKQITQRCGQKSVFILYFYKNDSCDDCTKQGYVLTSLRETYPNLRVYSFDYNLDLSAINAMKSIYKVSDTLPALVINGKVYSGLQNVDDIVKAFPELQTIKVDTTTPTTTKSTTKTTTKTTTPTTPTAKTN
jgi:uncharacterized protein YdcH (DUF465 family)